ncbi:hypothetical protein ATANTOWER_027120 [Ataeniobius toweri]|uniref:Uncharacterized protein n=1 Tax=Ataeniobius toweri TaxID=208326 RepID=A0ABU7BBR9_9TELE|nr:hypothetical protein [Ataeniobius toweri]
MFLRTHVLIFLTLFFCADAEDKSRLYRRLSAGFIHPATATALQNKPEVYIHSHHYGKVKVLVLVVFCLSGTGSRGQQTQQRHPDVPLPQTPLPAPPGGAQGVPRPAERHSPSSVSWAVPWASSRWDVPGTPPEEGVQEAFGIDARATSTGSSRCGGAAALLRAPPGWPSSSPYL